jgi:hypothetical protein
LSYSDKGWFLAQVDFALLQNNIKILSNHEILHFGILVRSSNQKSYLCPGKDSFFDFNKIAKNGKIFVLPMVAIERTTGSRKPISQKDRKMNINTITNPQHYLEEHGLIYLREIDKVGIHVRGLANLIDCDHAVIAKLLRGGSFGTTIEAEVKTAGGVQATKFILEDSVINLLETIQDSTRIKAETRQNAKELYRRFAKAGFKLFGMLRVAPEELGFLTRQSPPQKPKSLLDLSSTELYALIARRGLVDTGKNPPVSIDDKFDPSMLEASLGAVLYAFFQKTQQETELSELTERMEGAPSAKGFGKPSKNEKQIASTRKLVATMGDQKAEFEAFERSMQLLEGATVKALGQ